MSFVKTLLAIILPLIIGAGIVFGIAKLKPDILGLNNISVVKNDDQEIINKLSKLIALPLDEKPTIATISDLKKVAGQDFYSVALLNDKVIIYANNRKAILYRPSENKIVEVGVVNINEIVKQVVLPLATPSESATQSATPKGTVKPTVTSSGTPKASITPKPSSTPKVIDFIFPN